MPAKTVSEHIKEVMNQIDKVQPITKEEERVHAHWSLYHLFKAIQAGKDIIPPLYPKTNLAMPIVEEYRKTLKPSDILDDLPGPFKFQVRRTETSNIGPALSGKQLANLAKKKL